MPKMPKAECRIMFIDFTGWVEDWQKENPDHATWTCKKHGVQHYTGLTLAGSAGTAYYCAHCLSEFFAPLPRMTLNKGEADA